MSALDMLIIEKKLTKEQAEAFFNNLKPEQEQLIKLAMVDPMGDDNLREAVLKTYEMYGGSNQLASESNSNSSTQASAGAQTGSGTASGGAIPPDDKDKDDSKKKETSDNGRDFFDNTSYTDKVKRQSSQGDNHGFPESVDGFADKGKVTEFKGGDGKTYWKLEIKGEYKGKQGIFEYIKGADGKINHRLFVPNK